MTPKSLLRLPAATSTMEELQAGGFRPVIDDTEITDRSRVKRIVFCSGKVFYDLDEMRRPARERGRDANVADADVAVVRLEQFYPFPSHAVTDIIASYPNAAEIVWTQEEPQNMGGWTFVEPRLRQILPANVTLRYVGRTASASPATGSYAIHGLEQEKLVRDSLTILDAQVAEASTQ
jgi:multifunctional 2-oxoglutarate metabolism enzyme